MVAYDNAASLHGLLRRRVGAMGFDGKADARERGLNRLSQTSPRRLICTTATPDLIQRPLPPGQVTTYAYTNCTGLTSPATQTDAMDDARRLRASTESGGGLQHRFNADHGFGGGRPTSLLTAARTSPPPAPPLTPALRMPKHRRVIKQLM